MFVQHLECRLIIHNCMENVMNINLQTVRFKAGNELQRAVNEKVVKLFRQNKRILHADITLYHEASSNPKNKFCKIEVVIPGKTFFAKKSAGSFEQSVSDVIDALLKRCSEKGVKTTW